MSLTQILQMPLIKEAFENNFKRPNFPEHVPPLAIPPEGSDRSLVGIAFDCLFRSEVSERLISKRRERFDQESKARLSENLKVSLPIIVPGERSLRIFEFLPVAELGLFRLNASDDVADTTKIAAKQVWDQVKNAANFKFNATGEELTLAERINISLKMAKLEQIYRAGYIHEDFEAVDESTAQDVLSIFQRVDFDAFYANECCLLNPPFTAAGLVHGADADIVLDDLLVDLKTSADFRLTTRYLNQLFGYLVLSRLGGFAGVKKSPEIRRLGIYFARYDHLYTFDVEEVISEGDLKLFCKWFKKAFAGTAIVAVARPVCRIVTVK
jgi:hypothetical protein